jgi:hypothetical protein
MARLPPENLLRPLHSAGQRNITDLVAIAVSSAPGIAEPDERGYHTVRENQQHKAYVLVNGRIENDLLGVGGSAGRPTGAGIFVRL